MSENEGKKTGGESAEAIGMLRDIEKWEAEMAELDQDIAKIDEIEDPEARAKARKTLPLFRKIGGEGLDVLRAMHRSTVRMDAMLNHDDDDGEPDVAKLVKAGGDILGILGGIHACIVQMDAAVKRLDKASDATNDE